MSKDIATQFYASVVTTQKSRRDSERQRPQTRPSAIGSSWKLELELGKLGMFSHVNVGARNKLHTNLSPARAIGTQQCRLLPFSQ